MIRLFPGKLITGGGFLLYSGAGLRPDNGGVSRLRYGQRDGVGGALGLAEYDSVTVTGGDVYDIGRFQVHVFIIQRPVEQNPTNKENLQGRRRRPAGEGQNIFLKIGPKGKELDIFSV